MARQSPHLLYEVLVTALNSCRTAAPLKKGVMSRVSLLLALLLLLNRQVRPRSSHNALHSPRTPGKHEGSLSLWTEV
jgi:hypothetical protein